MPSLNQKVRIVRRIAGWYEHARRCLKMARRYLAEGDSREERRFRDVMKEVRYTRIAIRDARRSAR